MLGKVFENLLEVKDRKSKGAFYTPREIVHYMCQESLINYLETNSDVSHDDLESFIQLGDLALDSLIKEQEDLKKYKRSYQNSILPNSIKENYDELDELLKDIKVVDPAVGSGAFPVGMMNEILRARSILSVFSGTEGTTYDLKREIIENCLYGVDIESSAVDITKLRFWLSLIVDETDIHNIKPLPNLDHKIMCGNSLLEEFEGIKLFDEKLFGTLKGTSPRIDTINTNIKSLKEELRDIRGDSTQITRAEEIDAELKKLRRKKKRLIASEDGDDSQSGLYEDESKKRLRKLKSLQKEFFNERGSQRKKELRNKIETMEWELIEETLKENGNEYAMEKLEDYKKNNSKPFFLWKLYFAEVFQRENPGFDVVIANPPYITLALGKKQKLPISEKEMEYYNSNFKSSEYKGNTYVIFIEKGLSLLRNKGFLTFITPNTLLTNYYFKKAREYILKNSRILLLSNILGRVFEDAETGGNLITILEKENDKLSLEENILKTMQIQDPLTISHTPTKSIKQSSFNLMPNKKFLLNNSELKLVLKLKKGCKNLEEIATFYNGIKTGNNKKFLSKTKKSHLHKEVLRGRDIQKYSISFNSNYVLFDKEKLWSNTNESNFLAKEKIIVRQTADKLIGAYDNEQYFTLDTTHLIIPKNFNTKYILALINSNLMNFYYKVLVPETGKTFAEVKIINLKKLPIYSATLNEQNLLQQKVDMIIELNKKLQYEINNFKKGIKEDYDIEKFSKKLDKYYKLNLKEFKAELKKKKVDFKSEDTFEELKERFNESIDFVEPLIQKINENNKNIDEIIYKIYNLTPEEIEIVENFDNN
jgi:hypothetical protein